MDCGNYRFILCTTKYSVWWPIKRLEARHANTLIWTREEKQILDVTHTHAEVTWPLPRCSSNCRCAASSCPAAAPLETCADESSLWVFQNSPSSLSLSLRSPPLTLFAFWSVEEGKKCPVSGFVKLRGARPPGFGVRLLPGFGVGRGSEPPLALSHFFFLVQGNETKPCSWLFTASPCLWSVSALHTEHAHTQTHTLALSK